MSHSLQEFFHCSGPYQAYPLPPKAVGPATPPSCRLRANPGREPPGSLHSAQHRRMHEAQRTMHPGEPGNKYNFLAAASTAAAIFRARLLPHCRLLSVRHALQEAYWVPHFALRGGSAPGSEQTMPRISWHLQPHTTTAPNSVRQRSRRNSLDPRCPAISITAVRCLGHHPAGRVSTAHYTFFPPSRLGEVSDIGPILVLEWSSSLIAGSVPAVRLQLSLCAPCRDIP